MKTENEIKQEMANEILEEVWREVMSLEWQADKAKTQKEKAECMNRKAGIIYVIHKINGIAKTEELTNYLTRH